MIREVEGPAEEASGGPRRRYYGMTELGLDVARAEGLRVARLHQMIRESALLREGTASQEAGP